MLNEYCKRWKLTINIAKTKVLFLGKVAYYLRILHSPIMGLLWK